MAGAVQSLQDAHGGVLVNIVGFLMWDFICWGVDFMFPQQEILGTSSLFVLQLSELSNEFGTPVSRQSSTGRWSCMCVLGGGLAHNSHSELCLFSNSCYLHLCLYVAVVTDILKPLKRYILGPWASWFSSLIWSSDCHGKYAYHSPLVFGHF